MRTDPLDALLAPDPPPFALIHRSARRGIVDILVGEISLPGTLAEIPLPEPDTAPGAAVHDVLVLVPYRQLAERGLRCPDDGTPLIAMTVTGQCELPVAEVVRRIPDVPINLSGERFEPGDDAYAETVRQVVANEIGTGEGANFVIKRAFTATLSGPALAQSLALFRKLLERESGTYWTFIVHTGTRTLVGATPERHISLRDGVAVMNPISGTYGYPPSGPSLSGVMDFLADRKEAEELYMVLDEELKMMARVCDTGGRVRGPYLKEMARLAHTEYVIEGRSAHDPRDILRETMFAPTVTGSPLESACRVIDRYEPEGRGYYSGVVALIGRDGAGRRTMDSAIVIRTADIDAAGRLRIGLGATLVRHSRPASEVDETRAKASGLLSALRGDGSGRFGDHPLVRAALDRRNETLAGFWLTPQEERAQLWPALTGRSVLIIDAEDTFTEMIAHQLRALGPTVAVRRFDESYALDGYDLVIMGPGPGDPRRIGDPKIAHLRATVRRLLTGQHSFAAVCLSHQVLCAELGLELIRRDAPAQGLQREIDLFGVRERVGFYNTFAARNPEDKIECSGVGVVELSRDPGTGEVHALRGPRFVSLQFHAESVLTQGGERILGTLLTDVLAGSASAAAGGER
ncbi:anthranilate synthase family protein [Sphaerimonospora thailandensis]|uniref:anthranilate synthase n=1 Tax=Sphaerimonospora thailandensis TaxID=795644 RepID=A0A8J3R3Z6_9ACTN|nr:anthranilate synthase family protein [Sphaerimonospora thailandensis]GIH67988.1 phenazine-specific anthranilate synthase component I [Sphaerimonospora thailandensis]